MIPLPQNRGIPRPAHWRRLAAAGLGLLLSTGSALPAETAAQSPPAAATAPSGVEVAGTVDHPTRFTVQDLRKLRPSSQRVFFSTGKGPVTADFTGVPLWTVLQQVGITSKGHNDSLRKYLLVAGTDGYTVLLSLAELDPHFGAGAALLAYEQDGKPLSDEGSVRLIVPGDKAGGRDVRHVASIRVVDAP